MARVDYRYPLGPSVHREWDQNQEAWDREEDWDRFYQGCHPGQTLDYYYDDYYEPEEEDWDQYGDDSGLPEAYMAPYDDGYGDYEIQDRYEAREARRYGRTASDRMVQERRDRERQDYEYQVRTQQALQREYESGPCKMPKVREHGASDLTGCSHVLKYAETWQGQGIFHVANPNPSPKDMTLLADPGYAALFRGPSDLRQAAYERSMMDGREGNPYTPEAMRAPQALAQFLTCDFAPGKQDPYTRPVSRPNRGQTLGQARFSERMPPIRCSSYQ